MRYFACLLVLIPLLAPIASSGATISIIIDDIGYKRSNSIAAANIDPSVTLALLPDAPYSSEVAAIAADHGNELMLHLPMQSSVSGSSREPQVLSLEQSEAEFKAMVENMLQRFPQVRGVNNHQGSLLTQQSAQMSWLMQSLLKQSGLYFVDSRTHAKSVAARVSRQFGLETAERTIFLDADGDNLPSAVSQAQVVLRTVESEPFVVIIAHPFDASIQVLRALVPELKRKGHDIVPVSHLILMTEHRQFLAQCAGLIAHEDGSCSFPVEGG